MLKLKKVTDKDINDTGERMIPAFHESSNIFGEHTVRYEAATPLVKGKVVLDIASGSGYGTYILAEEASKVYGVDVSEEAIEYSKRNYSSNNIEYRKGDGVSIPLEDNSVDVIISFETIEHIENYKKFMDEVSRILRPDGLLVLSTPNDLEFFDNAHFHIHQFNEEELKGLVKKHFSNIKSYYQGSWIYTGLFEKEMINSKWSKDVFTMQESPISIDSCTYFYMLCSNRDITEKIDPIATISEHWSARKIQEATKINETAAHKQLVRIERQHAEIARLKQTLALLQSRVDRILKTPPGRLINLAIRVRRKIKSKKN